MCGVFHTFAIKTVEVRFVCLCIYFHFSLIKSLLIILPFQYGLTNYMFRWIYFTKKTFYLFWDASTCSYLKYVNITCCSLKQNVVFRWGARCPISINNGMSKQRPSVIHIYTQHISTFDRGQCIKGMRRKCFLTNDFLKSHMLLAMFLTILFVVTYPHLFVLPFPYKSQWHDWQQNSTSHESLSTWRKNTAP